VDCQWDFAPPAALQLIEQEPEPKRTCVLGNAVPLLQLAEQRLGNFAGYEADQNRRQKTFMQAMITEFKPPRAPAAGAGRRHALHDLMGARHIVLRDQVVPELGDRPLVLEAPGRKIVVYVNETPLPRAFVVPEARLPAAGADPIQALHALDPRREVVLDQDVLAGGARQGFTSARTTKLTHNTLQVHVETAAPGYLVLTENWMPGWRAEDNGQPVDVLCGDVAFRVVPLPAGTHRLLFRYHPPGLTTGAIVSAIAGLFYLGLVAVYCLRHRRVTQLPAGS
jgi:hypothetical protein